jgi:spore coat protein CotH
MINNRHIDVIVAVIVVIALVGTICAIGFSSSLVEAAGGTGINMQYKSKIFDTSEIDSIDIIIDQDQWDEMISNAIDETYYMCDIVINGTKFTDVGIRCKGNTSLSTLVSEGDTERFSFKVEFDHYVKGQTAWGLDKLVLNNNYADATSMKEAIVYDMFQYLGVESSLYNYADISVNGSTWGVYLALESVEDSFELRNFGTSDGNLYKPDNMNFGGAGGMMGKDLNDLNDFTNNAFGFTDNSSSDSESSDSQQDQNNQGIQSPPDMASDGTSGTQTIPQFPQGNETSGDTSGTPTMPQMPSGGTTGGMSGNMPGAGGGGDNTGSGTASSSGGADLNYVDDSLDSYSSIWEGEVGDTTKSDHEKVVTALKNISEGNDLEKYMNVENVLKYMAVQTFVVNLDSLSGNMDHNYYLYEQDGQLNIIPWDYNLAFGGFQGGSGSNSSSSVVNFAIDTPFSSSISLSDREFFAALLENDEYLSEYHEFLNELVQKYVYGGEFNSVYTRIRSQIDTLVQNDPTAFYTYDEYNTACEMLCNLIQLRAESIEGQLNGTIPSTNDGQAADSSSLIDSSSITLSVMGTMNNGGGQGDNNNMGGGQNNGGGMNGGPGNMPSGGRPNGNTSGSRDSSNSTQMQPPSDSESNTNSSATSTTAAEASGTLTVTNMDTTASSGNKAQNGTMPNGGQMPGASGTGGPGGNMPGGGTPPSDQSGSDSQPVPPSDQSGSDSQPSPPGNITNGGVTSGDSSQTESESSDKGNSSSAGLSAGTSQDNQNIQASIPQSSSSSTSDKTTTKDYSEGIVYALICFALIAGGVAFGALYKRK